MNSIEKSIKKTKLVKKQAKNHFNLLCVKNFIAQFFFAFIMTN